MSSNILAINKELTNIEESTTKLDNKEINNFVRSYQKFVYHTALRYTKDYDLSEDITQEVFLKALKNIYKFQNKSSIKTWLYRITINECKNQFRRKKIFNFFNFTSREEEGNEIEDRVFISNTNPENQYLMKETELLFLKVYQELPEKQRETFALRYFDELSYEEISEILGTSIGGLKANYYQAVRKIAKKLNYEIGT
jgi:RNA polymerase sigma-70 factor (ECF subfamily)